MAGLIDLAQASPFRLGPLLVEPPGLRVRAIDAREESVEPRVMQVLIALAEARGEVVSRDELIRRCWDGRIVGDDAINRVIGRLRRMAEGLGGGAFHIETVTKVGYRLVNVLPPVAGAFGNDTVEPIAWPGKRWPLMVAVAAAVLMLVGGALFFRQSRQAAADAQPVVSFAGFSALDAGSRSAARAMAEELRTALQGNSVVNANGKAAPTIAGTLRRAAGALRLTVRVDDPSRGRTLWSGAQQVPADDAAALAGAMQELADAVRCGLDGLGSRSPRLNDEQMGLYFTYCFGTNGPLNDKDMQAPLAAARALTRSAPGFVNGWLAVASLAGGVLFERSDEALRAEGLAAARRIAAMRPDLGNGYAFEAVLLPASRAVERERLLRKAAPLPFIQCRCGRDFLGDFLLQSGRVREALAVYEEAEGDKIGGPTGGVLTLWRRSVASELTGDRATSDRLFAKLEADFGSNLTMRHQRAVWRGDWASLLSSLAGPLTVPLPAPIWRETITALARNDIAAKADAASKLRALPLQGREDVLPHLLAQLGDRDAAFAMLEQSRQAGGLFAAPGRFPGMAQPLVWDPALRPLWRDARFGPFLRRAGFIDYWRRTPSRPDVCAEPVAPAFCGAL